jgi:hypothetical protein
MRALRVIAALAAMLSLGACSAGSDGSGESFRQSIGLDAPAPDEFLVVARQPLQPPPSFDALPPPQLGAPSRVEPDPVGEARAALLADGAEAGAPAASASERALLAETGAASVGPVDRAAIAAEARPQERRFGLDSLFGYEINQNPDADDRLDSRAEAGRLQAEGVPAPTAPPVPE